MAGGVLFKNMGRGLRDQAG